MSRLWKLFLAYFHWSDKAVCEMSVAEALAINAPGSLVDTAQLRALVEENARLKAALVRIAHGNIGTLDPAGDGGTYIIIGNEWREFREIARAALTKGEMG